MRAVCSGKDNDQAPLPTALESFYANRPLMWRNLAWFIVLSAGWSIVFTAITPLMTLRMNSPEVGMGERWIATIFSMNGYLVSFLVMCFSWKSDHTVSRWGRRIPYLWISAPPIIVTLLLFPLVHSRWLVVPLVAIQLFFMDMKNSTITLLPIDLVPRAMLARSMAIQTIMFNVTSFLALRYGMRLSDLNENAPYWLGAGILLCTTTLGLFIREPPIREPTTERFKPWSALKVGWRDRRMILLMVSVPLLSATLTLYNAWIWLFAKNTLNLTRTDMGAALSWAMLLSTALAFPSAWLIDRVSPAKLIPAYVAMQFVLFLGLLHVNSATGLIGVSFLYLT